MDERINKPRVFLSHSKKNSDFIEKLANDLRKCQIEPWLDTDQIRHGKSWQDSIFELGLPTCDAIIVYFTELSIQSSIVRKEMDVGLLQNLKDSNIAFLPYVNNEKLRGELRPDIQSLQVPEWNDENYHFLLPRVVAEIWRSYLERTISAAVKDERLKRIQLELELEKRKNQDENIFSPSENAEFEFISHFFDKQIKITLSRNVFRSEHVTSFRNVAPSLEGVCIFKVDLLAIFAKLIDIDEEEYYFKRFHNWLFIKCAELTESMLSPVKKKEGEQIKIDYKDEGIPNILEELRQYGLVESVAIEAGTVEVRSWDWEQRVGNKYIYTKKFFRYRYWLAYQNKLKNEIDIKLLELRK